MHATANIFALASAAGRGGVAVFRVSGPKAGEAIRKMCRVDALPKPREAVLHKLYHPTTGDTLDEALVIYFAAPNSFTGEDVVEFHTHGGRAIAQVVTQALQALPDFRLAEPGEFSRRAFENGKLDLTEAEAIADLVDAETEAQRRQALAQYGGVLGKLYEKWRAVLLKALAYFEASIDFADEDLPKDIADKQTTDIEKLLNEIQSHLNDGHRGERLRDGFSIAILGPPNAGKSSLLNALARRDAAIVSSIAGTTRDVIEINLDLGGYPVLLADTAGLRDSADVIENEGIRRALKRAEQADLKLLVFDGATYPVLDEATSQLADENSIAVLNKADLLRGSVVGGQGSETQDQSPTTNHRPLTPISAQSGVGIQSLLDQLIHEIDMRFGYTGQPSLTRARHREALDETVRHLQRALAAQQTELRAEDLRLAMRALGRITGRVDVEDLLDLIFRDFCIGK